jgi:RimJ/RimL family protein N-acetyltransferase
MLKLVEINEQNWLDVRRLSVGEDQNGFLDSAVGILARGYVYRGQRARVLGIERDGEMIGIALVKDLDEEPACYDLQQFLIDARWQGKGYGTEALRLILAMLAEEQKYDCVEVCVKRTDAAALRVYEKVGFEDTGYTDEDAPDCVNWMYHF